MASEGSRSGDADSQPAGQHILFSVVGRLAQVTRVLGDRKQHSNVK